MIKYFISLLFFYFLTIFQVSFLADRFNLVFLIVIIWSFIEKRENNLAFFNALIGGFFLDIFSDKFIGFNVLILIVLTLLIKNFIIKHVRIPFIEKI
ncbi:MAG: hypothetical protein PHN37_01565 [Candidatus Pacebacteria bacterium]|nr:hypothetical protein [Candidatus Paceibacterota bacterium]